MEVSFQPEMIGRDAELKELEAYLDKAIEGEGSTVFISGEAGVGKTRLVNELGEIAKSRGFQVLTGCSMHESLTPYMPFLDALRSGGLESLFSEEAPKVEAVYLVTHGGVLISDVVREDSDLNPALFASMLTAVGNFVKDSFFQQEGVETQDTLRKLSYGDHEILVERGKNTNLVVVLTGKENEFLIEDMIEALSKIDRMYSRVLDAWEGDEEDIIGIDKFLKPLITSGKYDGVYYGKEDPQARRNLLFENVSLGLIRHAQLEPTVLCIEDLQWVDPSSLALMHYVARNAGASGLMMLGTYRPEDVAVTDGKGHPLTSTMQLMGREDLYEKLELQRLPRESLDGLLYSMFGDCDFDDDFKEVIYRDTEGNPLFIIELAKLLVEDGIVKRDSGTWKLAQNINKLDVPSKVRDVIARRLNRVSGEGRKVLEYASVIGEAFGSRILADVLGTEMTRLLEQLRNLEQTHGLIHPSDGLYRFDHAKMKEILYDEIPLELRAERHRSIAQSIERLNEDDLDEVVGDLAFHYSQSGSKEEAVRYLMRAAEKAKSEYSNEEAIRFYQEALAFGVDPKKELGILENLALVFELIGEYEKSIESYEAVLSRTEEEKKLAMITSKIGFINLKLGNTDESLKRNLEVLHLVEGQECEEKAFILNIIGGAFMFKGEPDKALGYLKEGLRIREKIGNQVEIEGSLHNIGSALWKKGEVEEGLDCINRALKLGRETGHLPFVHRHLSSIGSIYQEKGEYKKAFEYLEEGLAVCEKIGDLEGAALTHISMGVLCIHNTDFVEALSHGKKGLTLADRIRNQYAIGYALYLIGNASLEIGEYDEALSSTQKSLEISEEMDDKVSMAERHRILADVYLRKGELERSSNHCTDALDLIDRNVHKREVGLLMLTLGAVLREQEEWEESIENLEGSIRLLENIGDRHGLADSYYEYGVMWSKRGDFDEARTNLSKAIEIYEDLQLDQKVGKAKVALGLLEKGKPPE